LPCNGGQQTIDGKVGGGGHYPGPGVYEVPSACALTLDFSKGDITCVSFVVDNGNAATSTPTLIQISSNGTGTLTSYGSCLPPPVTPAESADNAVIWSSQQSPWVELTDTPPAGTITFQGTLYMPSVPDSSQSTPSAGNCNDIFGGTICFKSNTILTVNGQAIANYWNIQAGDHPNPTVNYTPNNTVDLAETLKLVE
jgi:hypothetical protein